MSTMPMSLLSLKTFGKFIDEFIIFVGIIVFDGNICHNIKFTHPLRPGNGMHIGQQCIFPGSIFQIRAVRPDYPTRISVFSPENEVKDEAVAGLTTIEEVLRVTTQQEQDTV